MEELFDIEIDFENLSSIQMPGVFETQWPQETIVFQEAAPNGKKTYICTAPECGKAFRYKSEFNRHSVIHDKERPYSCHVQGCQKTFKRVDALRTHMWSHDPTNPNGGLPYSCKRPGCYKKFTSKSAFKYHELKHLNACAFKCEFVGCDKSFQQAWQLKKHQNICNFNSNYLTSPEIQELSQRAEEYFSESFSEFSDSHQSEIETRKFIGRKLEADLEKQLGNLIGFLLNENRILKEKIDAQDFLSAH